MASLPQRCQQLKVIYYLADSLNKLFCFFAYALYLNESIGYLDLSIWYLDLSIGYLDLSFWNVLVPKLVTDQCTEVCEDEFAIFFLLCPRA